MEQPFTDAEIREIRDQVTQGVKLDLKNKFDNGHNPKSTLSWQLITDDNIPDVPVLAMNFDIKDDIGIQIIVGIVSKYSRYSTGYACKYIDRFNKAVDISPVNYFVPLTELYSLPKLDK